MAFLITLLALLVPTIIFLVFYRLRVILDPKRTKPIRHGRRHPEEPTHLLIVLGSGGHTAEMMAMLDRAVNEKDANQRLDWRDYTHRTWVVGTGDSISTTRAKEFEDTTAPLSSQDTLMAGKVKKATDRGPGTYEVITVPRARAIHQPLYTSPLSSFKCLVACYQMLVKQADKGRDFPDLILCNGPATATILIFTTMLLRFFNVKGCDTNGKMRTIYVESWARVKKLSLSGTLLAQVADRVLVQWPKLARGNGRAEYLGVLV